jgi:hypothetical protein
MFDRARGSTHWFWPGLDQSSRALLLAAFCTGCLKTYAGDGVPAEESRPLRGFDRVSTRGALELEVARGDFGVDVNIDQNLLPHVSTTVSDHTLVVEVSGGNLGKHLPGPHVLVKLPTLKHAELNGTGRLVATGFDDGEDLSVELWGSGYFSWSGNAKSLDALLNGRGSLSLDGTSSSLDINFAGSGSLDARSLRTSSASIKMSGPGSISATVDGRVDASVTGGGDIELYGKVVRGNWSESEGGTISVP